MSYKRLLILIIAFGICNTLIFYQLTEEPAILGSIEKINWKTFTDSAGLFSIQYPSKWTPTNVSDPLGSVDVQFRYDHNDSFAYVGIYASPNSLYTNPSDMIKGKQVGLMSATRDIRLEQGIECEKYMINGAEACSLEFFFSYPDEKQGRHLLVADAVDDAGIEYSFILTGTDDVFETFKPVFNHMVDSSRLTALPQMSLIPSD
jgi:PsbP